MVEGVTILLLVFKVGMSLIDILTGKLKISLDICIENKYNGCIK